MMLALPATSNCPRTPVPDAGGGLAGQALPSGNGRSGQGLENRSAQSQAADRLAGLRTPRTGRPGRSPRLINRPTARSGRHSVPLDCPCDDQATPLRSVPSVRRAWRAPPADMGELAVGDIRLPTRPDGSLWRHGGIVNATWQTCGGCRLMHDERVFFCLGGLRRPSLSRAINSGTMPHLPALGAHGVNWVSRWAWLGTGPAACQAGGVLSWAAAQRDTARPSLFLPFARPPAIRRCSRRMSRLAHPRPCPAASRGRLLGRLAGCWGWIPVQWVASAAMEARVRVVSAVSVRSRMSW